MKQLGVELEIAVLKLKNAAGTFVNAFANATTAARTWTFPDKDITVAGIDDVALKQDVIKVLHVRDEKAAGTNGGASSVGSNTRTLNAVVTNTISGASLASNQITLPAGTYEVNFSAPCLGPVANHRAVLYNVTDTSQLFLGVAAYSNLNPSYGYDTTVSYGVGIITITATKVLELRHYISVAVGTFGLGGTANDGYTDVYASVLIKKIA